MSATRKLVVLAVLALAAAAGCDTGSDVKPQSQKQLANEVYRTCLQRGDMTQFECAEQAKQYRRGGG